MTTARQLAARVPVHRVDPAQLESIQVLLRTETRRPLAVAVSAHRRRYWQWLAIGAIGLLTGTAGVAAVRVGNQLQARPTSVNVAPTLPAVIVGLSKGARGHATSQLLDSPYELVDGEGEFDVGKMDEGRMFRVLAGKYVIEAQQAHFRLFVSNALLNRIEVAQGRVTVQEGDATVASLGAGQAYSPVDARPTFRSAGSAKVAPVPDTRKTPLPTDNVADENAFAAAFRLLGSGHAGQSAVAFDALLARGRKLDPSRRADVLYWAAQAHARAGNASVAEARARAYVESYPNSIHSGDAALLLGDYARGRGANAVARSYYERALLAVGPATRTRAQESLAMLSDG